jgi:hydrogenase maturation factor
MNNQQKIPARRPFTEITGDTLSIYGDASCALDGEGHCITCSDEALTAEVVSVDTLTGLALVTIDNGATEEEVDITLIDEVEPGNLILIHGGVAIANATDEAVSETHEAAHE